MFLALVLKSGLRSGTKQKPASGSLAKAPSLLQNSSEVETQAGVQPSNPTHGMAEPQVDIFFLSLFLFSLAKPAGTGACGLVCFTGAWGEASMGLYILTLPGWLVGVAVCVPGLHHLLLTHRYGGL